MTSGQSSLARKVLVLPPLLVGILVLAYMVSSRQSPVKTTQAEPTRSVRVVDVPLINLVAVAEGYGPVKPARVWTAVSQVSGGVTYIHPKLRDGEILVEGTELVHIDPQDYKIARAQANAELRELDMRKKNAQASLEIEKRNLKLATSEFERIRELAKQGTAAQNTSDQAERAMLAYEAAVQNQQNTLALVPAQRSLLTARLSLADRDLDHTIIRAPFDLRVANLKIEEDQYVPKGQSLFEGDAIDRVEIKAQVAMSSLRRLFIGRPALKIDFHRLDESVAKLIAIESVVQLDMGNHIAEWQAEFVRFSDIVDPETRTMGVVVAVDDPFDKVIPGYKPPLSKGMFARVVLSGKVPMERIVVPRSSIRAGTVFVVDKDSRLRRRAVRILFSQGNISVIEEGLEQGERIVVSDLVPAVDGMLLEVEVDEVLSKTLQTTEAGS
ncbi:MAG: efflux RND transporter periplasmic adaptor subunit [Gammaproteobacteria bacterium]